MPAVGIQQALANPALQYWEVGGCWGLEPGLELGLESGPEP